MSNTFDVSFKNLLGWEGGFSNNPHDAGGATNLGVIQTEYNRYRHRKGLQLQSVKLITSDEAKDIYRNEYWDVCRCDELNPGVANCLFDGAVNSGNGRGEIWLQGAVQSLMGSIIALDGVIGPKTIAAANACSAVMLINITLEHRLAFLKRARNSQTGELLWPHFGKGWQVRIEGVRKQSHDLAQQVAS